MGGVNYIALTDLLFQREAEFVKVWKCEQEVRRLLGGLDYPFDAPPALPSSVKVKRKPLAARKPAEPEPEAPVRPLTGAENAYRISYLYDGRRESTFQTDAALVCSLTRISNEEFRVLKVEAVIFQGMDQWQATDVLWSEERRNQG